MKLRIFRGPRRLCGAESNVDGKSILYSIYDDAISFSESTCKNRMNMQIAQIYCATNGKYFFIDSYKNWYSLSLIYEENQVYDDVSDIPHAFNNNDVSYIYEQCVSLNDIKKHNKYILSYAEYVKEKEEQKIIIEKALEANGFENVKFGKIKLTTETELRNKSYVDDVIYYTSDTDKLYIKNNDNLKKIADHVYNEPQTEHIWDNISHRFYKVIPYTEARWCIYNDITITPDNFLDSDLDIESWTSIHTPLFKKKIDGLFYLEDLFLKLMSLYTEDIKDCYYAIPKKLVTWSLKFIHNKIYKDLKVTVGDREYASLNPRIQIPQYGTYRIYETDKDTTRYSHAYKLYQSLLEDNFNRVDI